MVLPLPMTQAGRDGLRALLRAPGRSVVALDFDGTLSPIVPDPARARPAPGATEAIRRLAAHLDTLAVITGRPAETAAALLGLDDVRGNVVVLGHYGLERWTATDDVTRDAEIAPAAVDAVRAVLPDVLERIGAPAGTSIEDKGQSVAVHVRRTRDPLAALELLREPLADLAASHGLRLEPGRLVLELRPAGIDKGRALEQLVRERGVGAVWYAGDDLGDLAAFDAVDRLRAEGLDGLVICSASDEVPELAARADLVLDGPAALVAFLAQTADAVEEHRG